MARERKSGNSNNNDNNMMNNGWVKWAFIAFIAYAAFTSFSSDRALTKQDFTQDTVGKRPGTTVTVAGYSAKAAHNAMTNNMRIGGEISGSGDAVSCGEIATVNVNAELPDGTPLAIDGTTDKITKIISVGVGENDNKWAKGIAGMAKGGIRELLIPAKYIMDDKKISELGLGATDKLRFKVALENSVPSLTLGKMPLPLTG